MKFILARHCKASGQEREATLTKQGTKQADTLANFLNEYPIAITRIISSPYTRAKQSAEPFSLKEGMKVETDERLKERILSDQPRDDWMEILQRSFTELDLKVSNGESSNEAMKRATELLQELMDECDSDNNEGILLMTHGNLLTLMLMYFDKQYGYEVWKEMSNPDLYLVEKSEDRWNVNRIYT